jgi:RHS repeat-associated protein
MKDMKNIKVEYGYYDNGNRAWKRVTEPGQEPAVTCYVHDGVHVIAEYDGEGELLKEYVYSDNIDEVLNIKDVSKTYYPHQDGLNSVVAVTDADRERVASYNYEAFGTIKDATGALGNPITYTGRWIEPETGDYFYRARYYDSGIGRFLKRDPIGFDSNDYNFYRYVGNSSVNNIDPYGNYSKEEVCCELKKALKANSEIMKEYIHSINTGEKFGSLSGKKPSATFSPLGAHNQAAKNVHPVIKNCIESIEKDYSRTNDELGCVMAEVLLFNLNRKKEFWKKRAKRELKRQLIYDDCLQRKFQEHGCEWY